MIELRYFQMVTLDIMKVVEYKYHHSRLFSFVAAPWWDEKPEEIKQNIYKKTAIHRFATIDKFVDAFRFCINSPFINGR